MSHGFTFEGFGDDRVGDIRAAGLRSLHAMNALGLSAIIDETPVDTGYLRDHNGSSVTGDATGLGVKDGMVTETPSPGNRGTEEAPELDFFNSADYAPDVYFGTEKMKGRPWMGDAIMNNIDGLHEVSKRAVADYFSEKEGGGIA